LALKRQNQARFGGLFLMNAPSDLYTNLLCSSPWPAPGVERLLMAETGLTTAAPGPAAASCSTQHQESKPFRLA